jgi:hypothetical protein
MDIKLIWVDGGGQKAHVLSPLDFRLSSYLMAMFNFNFKFINYLNTFNEISKDKYLSWKDKSSYKFFVKEFKELKPTFINKMPIYCKNTNLGQYSVECSDISCSFYYLSYK